jgi:hypothetical protein
MVKSLINKLRNGLLLGTAIVSIGLTSCLTNPFRWPQIDGEYRGIVVFATNHVDSKDDIIMQTIMDQLQNDQTTNDGKIKSYSIQNWFEIQAEKYNKSIKIDLEEYPKELRIPQKFIDNPGTINDGRPQQFDVNGYLEYLRNNYPELKKYDFIAIESPPIHINVKNRGVNSRTEKGFYVTIVRQNYIITNQNSTFAHEFCHILGGENKYETLENKTWKPNPNFSYKNDIMYSDPAGGLSNNNIICPQTAKEMGWN